MGRLPYLVEGVVDAQAHRGVDGQLIQVRRGDPADFLRLAAIFVRFAADPAGAEAQRELKTAVESGTCRPRLLADSAQRVRPSVIDRVSARR